jgi:hypothetical protein
VKVSFDDEQTAAPLHLDLALRAHRKAEKALGQVHHRRSDVLERNTAVRLARREERGEEHREDHPRGKSITCAVVGLAAVA